MYFPHKILSCSKSSKIFSRNVALEFWEDQRLRCLNKQVFTQLFVLNWHFSICTENAVFLYNQFTEDVVNFCQSCYFLDRSRQEVGMTMCAALRSVDFTVSECQGRNEQGINHTHCFLAMHVCCQWKERWIVISRPRESTQHGELTPICMTP